MANSYREALEKLKEEAKEYLGAPEGELTVLDFIARACALSLSEGKRQQYEEVTKVFEERLKDLNEVEPRMEWEKARRNEAHNSVTILSSLTPREGGE